MAFAHWVIVESAAIGFLMVRYIRIDIVAIVSTYAEKTAQNSQENPWYLNSRTNNGETAMAYMPQ